jgi:phenylalanyl-tRNA synthetase beta chain
MYISLNWLGSFLRLKNVSFSNNLIKINKRLLYSEFPTNQLTLTGFEVEDIEEIITDDINDVIIEIKVTPNRSDINNMVGLSQEIKSLMNIPLAKTKIYPGLNEIPRDLNFGNLKTNIKRGALNNPNLNSFFVQQIENTEIKDSPMWIKKRLLSSKILPTNNITDIANYIMLQWGQPLLIHDLDKVKRFIKLDSTLHSEIKIGLRYGKEKEKFLGVNNLEYELTPKNLVITANDVPIEILGIMQQRDTVIDLTTKKILIQCGNFNSQYIRQSSKRFGIKTENTNLNGKGISNKVTKLAFQHSIKLITLLSNQKLKYETINLSNNLKEENRYLNIKFYNIREILGTQQIQKVKKSHIISNDEILDCLRRLNFEITEITEEKCKVEIPHSRFFDLESEIDIIEEIGRVLGFNNILPILPKTEKIGKISNEQKLINVSQNFFIDNGFNELITYSLTSANNQNNIKLINPLGNEYSSLRTTLFFNLLNSVSYNKNQRNYINPCFEISRVFNQKLKQEYTVISGIFGSQKYKTNWTNGEQTLNWYEGKGNINKFFSLLNLNVDWQQIEKNLGETFHPGRSALIHKEGLELGTFSQIHPLYAKQKNLENNLFFFELNLTRISQFNLIKKEKYIAFSSYPKITKDLSFEVQTKISISECKFILERVIFELNQTEFEIHIELFDYYKKPNQKEVKILGFKLTYQSFERTLLKTEIEVVTEKIVKNTKEYLSKLS